VPAPRDSRRICVHGHFYQPPRENPWLEEIEVQDSAFPYHDWNERVAAECYGPNSASRILDPEGRIARIVNNYARISHDFGPTLLLWLRRHEPGVYEAVLRADRESRERFSGHGGAMAQAYNHMIMPLANSRDKRTQIAWGLKDFESRFGRPAEGMWLPETAVDSETLDLMAERGLAFTILAPHQAAKVRKKGDQKWDDASGGKIDPRKPYTCPLPSGRTIAIFFYDGPLAHDVAFGDLLKDGERFAQRLVGSFSEGGAFPQLVHLATDGETYGHHSRFGDMALAYALERIEEGDRAALTVYGEFLAANPPVHEVQIAEDTSWSCPHGVERWRSDCGCRTGAHPGWNQKWRAPLRAAMDWLRDGLSDLFEREAARLVRDPWAAREDYIAAILDRSADNLTAFLAKHAARPLAAREVSRTLRLLEMQRMAMLMFTSCGWFFDDLAGLESVQVLQYAARAIQLARDLGGADLEPEYVSILAKASSNFPERGDGRAVFDRLVKPAALDLLGVGAHYAVSSLFEEYPETASFGAYTAGRAARHLSEAGRQKVVVGRVSLRSEIVLDEEDLVFGVLHFGGHNLVGGVRPFPGEEALAVLRRDIEEAFSRADVPGVIDLLDKHFGAHGISLRNLFRDEKRKVLGQILEENLGDIEASFRRIYEDHYPIMLAMRDMNVPLPKAFSTPLEFVLNRDLGRLLRAPDLDFGRLASVAADFRMWDLESEATALGYLATLRLNGLAAGLSRDGPDLAALTDVESFLRAVDGLELKIDLWKCQNAFFFGLKDRFREVKARADRGERTAREWVEAAEGLAVRLKVRLD
jgi:hypothetical protein